MTTQTQETCKKQHLQAHRQDDQVVFHWGNDEPSVITMENLIKAMRNDVVESEGKRSLMAKLIQVHNIAAKWVEDHKHQISGAWLTERHGNPLLVATWKAGEAYNEALHDSLLQISYDVTVSPDLSPIELETILLPPMTVDGLEDFLAKNRAQHVAFAVK